MRTKQLDKLNAASRRGSNDPYTLFEWPKSLDLDQWFMSPELLSLYGTDVYDQLDEVTRKRLSFYEAVNFFSLNIHGEKALVAGLSDRLYREGSPELAEYLHHFLDEENKHMTVFGNFCLRYAGKVYPGRKLELGREYAEGEEEFLFFAKVLIFEEIVDAHNERMGQDQRLHPLARKINQYHHRDELRHLAFGRQWVRTLFESGRQSWADYDAERIRRELATFHSIAWREYTNPAVYRDAGLELGFRQVVELRDSAQRRHHRWSMSTKCRDLFLDLGVAREEMAA